MFLRLPNSALPNSALRRTGALAATAALTVVLGGCASDDGILRTPDGSVISTTVTRIAEVDIVNAGRDFAKTCLAPTAPDAGESDVARIVVTDPALLDALCALGMGAAVKGVAAPKGSVPEYLGPQLTAVPALGDAPDAAAVRKAAPEVVLSSPATADRVSALRDTRALGAARIVTVDPATDWQTSFREVAAAVNRSTAAEDRLTEFAAEAKRVGRVMDAAHTQVSLVRFTPDAEMIEGTASFGAQVMAQTGVDRPAAQRTAKAVAATDRNYRDADADLIYVSFDGEKGTERGKQVLLSDRWLDMGAPTWKRVLNVDDDVWYSGSGPAAAWLVLNDVKSSLNGSSAN